MRARPLILGLTAALMTTTAAMADMTAAERDAFRAEVRSYLLENPEVLIEAMDVLQSRQDKMAADNDKTILRDHAAEIFNDANSWVGGNPEGDITVVEFTDYRCGYCRRAYDEVNELIKSDGNIRFVVKEYPILGEQSMLSSQFAIAVRQLYGDDAYHKAHDALITLRAEASVDTMKALAKELGHDADAVAAKMDSAEVKEVIAANHALGELLQINGTPTFIVDQTMVRGYVPLDGMRQIVAQMREG